MNLARPVGRADVGAVCTFSCTGLAANRALQLGEPTGGVNGMSMINKLRVVMYLRVRQPPVLALGRVPLFVQVRR